MTVIIAGPVFVEPADRDRAVAGLRVVVEAARRYPGCLDVSISPDPVDPGRVNIFEHWATQEILDAWRAIAPPPTSSAELKADQVRRCRRGGVPEHLSPSTVISKPKKGQQAFSRAAKSRTRSTCPPSSPTSPGRRRPGTWTSPATTRAGAPRPGDREQRAGLGALPHRRTATILVPTEFLYEFDAAPKLAEAQRALQDATTCALFGKSVTAGPAT